MHVNLALNLKLQKVKDTRKAVLIPDVPESLRQVLKDFLEPGEYVLVVDTEEIEGGGLKKLPIIKPDQTSSNANTYQSIASWVCASRKGLLKAISFVSDTPGTANFKLTIAGTTIFTDKVQQNAVSVDLSNHEIKKGEKVEILFKSNGVAVIVADGLIVGEEVGS